MATGPEHYKRAEELLAVVQKRLEREREGNGPSTANLIGAATAHALLAQASATALTHETPWFLSAAAYDSGSGWATVAG